MLALYENKWTGTQRIEAHFSTHWVFLFQHKLCSYLTGEMDISSRTSSRIKAKEKKFVKHLLLALPLTLWAGWFIRGLEAPFKWMYKKWHSGRFDLTSCTFLSRKGTQPIIQWELLISQLWFQSVGDHVWADGEPWASRDTPSSFLLKNKQPEGKTPCF